MPAEHNLAGISSVGVVPVLHENAVLKEAEYVPAGSKAPRTVPGDFILTHGHDWSSWLITIGQRLRFRGHNRHYAYWNHAALIEGNDGEIIEAQGPRPGVVRANLKKYSPQDYVIVHIDASEEDRQETVRFAVACLDEEYGVMTIISIALSLLTGTRFSFGFDGQQICSGLVARSLERTRAIFKKEPSHIMPADLAKAYKAGREDVGLLTTNRS